MEASRNRRSVGLPAARSLDSRTSDNVNVEVVLLRSVSEFAPETPRSSDDVDLGILSTY